MKEGRSWGKPGINDGLQQSGVLHEEAVKDEDMKRIAGMLQEYVIPAPDEKRIDQTVNALTYMLRSAKIRRYPFAALARSITVVSHVMKYSNKWYALLCLFVYSFALTITLGDNKINPYVPSIVLGPVPFLLAVISVFSSKGMNMAELEMSFKYSLKELMMARFLLAAVLNTVGNAILSFIVSQTNPELDPLRLTFYWCVPFLLVSSVSLFIVLKIRSFGTSLGCLGIWSGLVIAVAANPEWLGFITESVKTEVYAAVTVVSSAMLFYDIFVLLSKTIERGDFLETYVEKHIKAI